ncbi:sulfotransferase 1 family member D1 [Trichonephila clavata]|uniref:Sulfotransferase 1 family member D1 n=2 Tax=Trichonephila clavata TaxID=2740835 RepID=A0A8X6F3F6_TRICU|nr:sulfotransferase 1 family member D1 [Trichonephila clavata]
MSGSSFGMPPSSIVDGFRMPHVFSAESFHSARQYLPRPDDVFIITYPKCGTTWAQQIIALIYKLGEPCESNTELLGDFPFLELRGAKSAENMSRPGAIKTHLPFNLAPWSEQAKYIHIARNPKDCCVSYYYHHQSHVFTGTFDDFFEMFLSGDINFGDYFDHLLSWYEHRNDPNVLFLTYEEMKENPEVAVLKIAEFIDDKKYAEPLKTYSEKLNNVVKYSSFQHMKKVVNKGVDVKSNKSSGEKLSGEITNTSNQGKETDKEKQNKSHMARLVRKGIVGDWRSHFSTEQSERLKKKFVERTKGTEIANIWKKYM